MSAKKTFTDTVAQGMAKANPELKLAPPERIQEKVKKSVRAYLLGGLAVLLLLGGCVVSGVFAFGAMKQHQPLSIGLMVALLVPLIPGTFFGGWALLRFDSDAGGVFTQLITLVGAARQAIKPSKDA